MTMHDSALLRNTVIALVIACTGLFAWGLFTLNSHDKSLSADDVKWQEQAEKHASIESFEKETAASIASINISLIQIRDDIAAIRRDLAGRRNLASRAGKE